MDRGYGYQGFFDNIDHQKMIDILETKIDDGKFIKLIKSFLEAGYLENWTFHDTYSGTPQGGISRRFWRISFYMNWISM